MSLLLRAGTVTLTVTHHPFSALDSLPDGFPGKRRMQKQKRRLADQEGGGDSFPDNLPLLTRCAFLPDAWLRIM